MEQKIKNYTLSLMLLSLTACGGVSLGLSEPKPQIDTPSKYSEKGLEFEYPANWNKSDVLDLSGIRQVTIESPGSALVVISVYPDSLANDISTYAKEFAEGISGNSPSKVSVGKMSQVIEQEGYEIVHFDFDISLLGQKVSHTCKFYRKKTGNHVCLITTQIAKEDLQKAKAGFELIRNSLTLNLE